MEGQGVGFVDRDQPCVRCGYCLRGLMVDDRCPECGTEVARSMRGDLLVYSDSEYVSRLRAGSGLVLLSLIGLFVVPIGGMVLGLIFPGLPDLVSAYARLITYSIFMAGWWVLATPDPGQLSTNTGERVRGLTRAGVVGMVLLEGGRALLPRGWVAGDLDRVLAILAAVVFGIAAIGGLAYLKWLARRLPDEKLHGSVSSTASLAWAYFGGRVVLLVGAWLFPPLKIGLAAGWVLGSLKVIVGVLGVVGFIMYFAALAKFRDRLDGVAGMQRAG